MQYSTPRSIILPLSFWLSVLCLFIVVLLKRFICGKRQQDVARHAAESRIAGIDEDHPYHDDGARPIERSTAALHAVHGLIIAGRVVIPKKSAVLGCEGPQVTVERSRKDYAWDCRHCR